VPRSEQTPPTSPKLISSSKPKEELPWVKKQVTNAGGTRGHLGDKPDPSASQKVGRFQNAAVRKLQKGF
jgi:hypothetical protein